MKGELTADLIDEALGRSQVTTIGPEVHQEIRQGGYGRWMYCKHCCRNVCPVSSHERTAHQQPTRQALCPDCDAGLTPCEEVSD